MRSIEEITPLCDSREAPDGAAGTPDVRAVGLMTLGHYVTDIYPGFIAPLLPLFIDRFGISLTLAGAIGTILSLSTSVSQFGFGWLADRIGRRFFIVMGPLMACVFLSFAPLSSSYSQLVILAALGGFGVAAFHPSAASVTGAFARGRKSLAVSIFASAGALGFATGPFLIIWAISEFGLNRSYLAMIPGLATVGIIALWAPKPPPSTPKERRGTSPIGDRWRFLFMLWFVAVIRAAVITGFENFIPIVVRDRGGTLMSGGAAFALFLLCGSLGGIAGGYLSDRVDPRRILLFSSLAPVPLLISFLKLDAPLNLICLGFAGAFAFAAVPVTIVMAQESVPGRTSTTSSIVMGLAWGIGGTSAAAVGFLADFVGVTTALLILAIFSVVSAPCVPFLPGSRAKTRVVPAP